MKTLAHIHILLVIWALSAASPAFANISLIVTATDDTRADDLEKVISNPAILRTDTVFSPSEQEALSEMGKTVLAQARTIEVRDERGQQELTEWVKGNGLAIELTRTSLPISLDSDDSDNSASLEPLENEQWALHNDGHDQLTSLDDITSIRVPGRAGEDLQIAKAPAEPPVGGAAGTKAPIIVAVLDSGIDANHPDLQAHILRKPEECAAFENYKQCLLKEPKNTCDQKWAKVDNDKNGYPMDCVGWNLTVGRNPITQIQGNGTTTDDVGHGTHVSGIIAAQRNGIGVQGVTQNAMILPVKVINTSPRGPVRPQSDEIPDPSERNRKWDTGFADIIARGLLYAIRSNAQVVNLSLAWPEAADSNLMREMVKLAQSRGILIVAAAGNDSTEARVMPCSYPGVICVASHGPDGTLSKFSNHGSSVDLAAPGLNILSTWPTGLRATRFTDIQGYEFKNGTSMAAPFVTGALARMLGQGLSPQEAYARLLIGSRMRTNSPDDLRTTRFGNLDLAQAAQVQEQPLILPESKDPIRIEWDRKAQLLPLTIALKNYWDRADQVAIDAKIAPELERFAALGNTQWSFHSWEREQSQALSTTIQILDSRIPHEIALELNVKVAGQPDRKLRVKVDITVPIAKSTENVSVELSRILGGTISPKVSIRSILQVGKASGSAQFSDYLAIEKSATQWKLQLLTRETDSGELGADYRIAAERTLNSPTADLLNLYRLDWNRDGKDEYVFVYTAPDAQGKRNAVFRFEFLDRALNPNRTTEYTATTTIIPEDFQWLDVADHLTPAWVISGYTPTLEKPSFDPWNRNPKDSPSIRFYYLASDGLRTIKAPKDYFFVSLLAATPAQQSTGTVPVLLAKGNSYQLTYATALVTFSRAKEPQVMDIQPLALNRYRMLLGADSVLPILSLGQNSGSAGTVFASPGVRGAMRTTLIANSDAASGASKILDFTEFPVSSADSVLRFAGAFGDETRSAAFMQTQYDLQYHDFTNGIQASTSLHRFSFLPQMAFLRSFIPVVVSESSSGRSHKQPGMLVLGDLSGGETSEVVVPDYDETGRFLRLISPAKLHLESGEGCQRIGNPIPADEEHASAVAFFCGDRIIRVALEY